MAVYVIEIPIPFLFFSPVRSQRLFAFYAQVCSFYFTNKSCVKQCHKNYQDLKTFDPNKRVFFIVFKVKKYHRGLLIDGIGYRSECSGSVCVAHGV